MMYTQKRRISHLLYFFTYILTCSFIIAAVFFSYTLIRKSESNTQAEPVLNDTEVDFVWETLRINSIVEESLITKEEKIQKLDQLAKQANKRVQAMTARMNKYAGLFGPDWYATQAKQYNQLLTAHYPYNVFLLPTLANYEKALSIEVESQLRSRSLLTTIAFDQFDSYRVVIDNDYVDFSHTIFESDTTSGKIWFSQVADHSIAQMAQSRGFSPKKLINRDELETSADGVILKKGVRAKYDAMYEAAAQEGVQFYLISAYRDPEEQRNLFIQEMQRYGIQLNQLSSEQYVSSPAVQVLLDKVMTRVAPPEYSRHQTGITIDLASPEGVDFGSTKAFQWLSKNNYYNAKRFGFLPSYPKLDELTKYGPNPEAWEYFYAGIDNTLDPNFLISYETK